MTNSKDDTEAAPAAEKQTTSKTNQKHSSPFYISDSLFHNKRLKQLRFQWAEALRIAAIRRKKTECRKKRLSALKADVTIDLLSDEGEHFDEAEQTAEKKQPQVESSPQNIILDGSATLQISQVPNITLIPVQKISTKTSAQNKNKRKNRPNKFTPPPPTCLESIILSDDEDDQKEIPLQQNAGTQNPSTAKPQKDETAFCNENINLNNDLSVESSSHLQVPAPPPPPVHQQASPSTLFAQVDDEVSVSLVPRSKASGTCSSLANAETLFPMLPDETTVHTVIANRIYELSLDKLREGLATCGVPEFADKQHVSVTPRRKRNFAPPSATPPSTPISLKLSSDLSISLISDDEDDDMPVVMSQRSPSLKIRTLNPTSEEENLLEPLPLQITAAGQNCQNQKKRKLG